MNDNEIKDLIKNDSEELEIPDSLSPENIEKKLSKKKGPRITHISDYHFKKDGTLVISPGFCTPWTLQSE